MNIVRPSDSNLADILNLHTQAFGDEEGPIVANLVKDLLKDQTAMPLLSLVASSDDQIVGHILFTRATITGASPDTTAVILAPLAIAPQWQNQGVGGQLIKEGLRLLSKAGTKLVFVLGHPGYYPRYGFKPAGALGLDAPYPILEKNADAWMVQDLVLGTIDHTKGKVVCAETMDKAEYWQE